MILRVEAQHDLATLGGDLQGLAHQRQRDFGLLAQLTTNDSLGNGHGQPHVVAFPLLKPGLFGVFDLIDGVFQGGHERGDFLLDLFFHDFFGCRQTGRLALLLGLLADAVGLLLCIENDLFGFFTQLGQVVFGLRGHVVEIESGPSNFSRVFAGLDDTRHRWTSCTSLWHGSAAFRPPGAEMPPRGRVRAGAR